MGLRLAKEQKENRCRGIGTRVGSRGAGLRLAEPSAVARSSSRCPEAGGKMVLTAAEVAFSWLDLPVTLKATPLGAVSLNSKVVAERW